MHSCWQKERGAAALLSGWAVGRGHTQHGWQPPARGTSPASALRPKGVGWQPLKVKQGDFSFARAVPAVPGVGNDEWCVMKGCTAQRNSSLNMAFLL